MAQTLTITKRPVDDELMKRARRAAQHAYAPFSRFHVGSAIRTKAEGIYEGANFENGSYGATICAERAAVAHAIALKAAAIGNSPS